MSSLKPIMQKDLRDMLLTPTTYLGPALAISYTAMMVTVVVERLNRNLGADLEAQKVVDLMQHEINVAAMALALLAILSLALGAATAAVVHEKKMRTLESLLATPVTLPQIWRAKTVTIALLCIPLGTLLTLGTVFVLCHWVVNPRLSAAVWPELLPLAAVLTVIPLAMYLLLDMYVGLQFAISNYRFSNLIFLVLLAGAIGMNILLIETEDSWIRYALMVAATAGLWVLDLFLAQFVTVERVVLGSKG